MRNGVAKEGCKKEEKMTKRGANSSKECCKKVKEEAENNDERGQPTKRIVGCNKSEKWGSDRGEKRAAKEREKARRRGWTRAKS